MTSELAAAAKELLAAQAGESTSSKQAAERAAAACIRFSVHLSPLLGEKGITTMLRRTIVVASAEFPWLRAAASVEHDSHDDTCSALREAMEHQAPETTTEAFVAILSTFVGLLRRLIGEGLVERLLHEVWPVVFPHAAKETR